MKDIYGKWPGDETEEELLSALKEMDTPEQRSPTMPTIFEACLSLVEQINNAKTLLEHQMLQSKLDGFYRGLEASGRRDVCIGSLIMDCDRYYMSKGIDRPMCGGVFLDWKETNDAR